MANTATVITLLLGLYCTNHAEADGINTCPPEQGFHLITNLPEKASGYGDLYIYALNLPMVGDDDTIEFSKDDGLPPNVETGVIEAEGVEFGRYLRARPTSRQNGARYGTYTADYIPVPGSLYDAASAYTFLKRVSKFLDTRGVFTVTIYPNEEGESSPLSSDSPKYVGVKWSPGCSKIVWCKGRVRNVNTGPKLALKSTEDAGLYTIRRKSRSKRRGAFVQIRVIAADCPPAEGFDGEGCTTGVEICQNGGVLSRNYTRCICPPLFVGFDCSDVVSSSGDNGAMVIGISKDENSFLTCKDLPGGNDLCKGYLFCFGDLYGCKCASGWHGNNCDTPCRKGKWGVDCSQKCPGVGTECDPYFGSPLE